jgi:hypothetical protein
MTQRIIFRESCHWYDWQGNPVDELVPYAKPRREGICVACRNLTWTDVKGDMSTCKACKQKIYVGDFQSVAGKEPDLGDARKYGLFPSITKMASYGEGEFELFAWSQNQLIEYIQSCYREDRDEWNKVIQEGLEAWRNRYSDPGSYVHGQIAKAMEGQPYDQSPTIIRAVEEIYAWEKKLGISGGFRERGHCDPELGVGGMIDFDSDGVTADYKCKHTPATFETLKKGGGRSWLKSAMKQIGGYIHISKHHKNRGFVIPIRIDETHPDSGEICPIELTNDEMSWGLECIKMNVSAWCTNQQHDPRKMYTHGECKTIEQIRGQNV